MIAATAFPSPLVGAVDPVEVATISIPLASAVLGLVIGYQAYRGFRRHESTSMRYLSIGLILLTAVSFSVAAFGTLLLRWDVFPSNFETPIRLLARVSQFVGLAFITYSLYRRP
ncbi:hypothetical protein HLRTI_001859 [Halorhabdus tiamatea SARL4B]|uniref:Uncharacterized protein n=1 Tax=Halorhabdus tiamatea SARL4B TaxID=1033806 RepID=F7PQE3_9EURY|nr:hypothetical protein [Halorhabdus tiamatea]ERJ06096.1 hypothetical protein HLRTI_001859 [Halorhabdus tiamatea SARL4B]CCQ33274.1 conserved hypothetical protein [Halorhabdus tiamatea SARL4B]